MAGVSVSFSCFAACRRFASRFYAGGEPSFQWSQWSQATPGPNRVPRATVLVEPCSKDVPWPTNLCARVVLTPSELLEQLAVKLQVSVDQRTGRSLVHLFWNMPTRKSSPNTAIWSDLVALALDIEYKPGSTSEVRDSLKFHAPYWCQQKVDRIMHAWSKHKRAQEQAA